MTRTLITGLLAVGFITSGAACTAGPDEVEATDPMITAAIQSQYFVDDTVKGRHIDVDTAQGVVTLTGTVESPLESTRALTIARETDGVVRVEDRLVVRPPDPPASPEPAAAMIDPAWITMKIEAQYFVDPDVKGRNVDVTTLADGTVRLNGTVDSPAVRDQAVAIARRTEGVTSVADELLVSSPAPADADEPPPAGEAGDAWITTKIQAQYFIDADVKGRNIDVTTTDGVVSLSGTVESEAERRDAVALARSTDGVKDVRDLLTVTPPAPPAESGTPESDMPVTDAWLTTKIQAKYFADPDVSGLAIEVTTVNRVVTLAGEVSSAAEKTLAENIARDTEGVRQVQNRLVVPGER